MLRDTGRGHRLLDAVVAIGADLELPDVLCRIVRAAVDLMDARYGALGVLGADGSRFAELVHVGMDDATVQRIGALPVGCGVLGLLLDEPTPVRVADISDHPRWSGFPPGHPRMASFLGVPIVVQGDVFGNLYLADKTTGEEFTAEDEQIAQALATAAGMAVHNARLHEQTRWRQAWLEASNEINAALLAGQQPGGELALVTARARAVAGAPVAAIALPDGRDPSRLVFDVVDGFGTSGSMLVGTAVDVATTASGMVFRTGRPLLIDSYGEKAAAWHGNEAPFDPVLTQLGSAAIVPLAAGENILGVLLLCRRRGEPSFGQADLELLENFAAHAALALQYTRAQADQHRLAVVEERDRIARDLHDLIIQRLFATGMALESAASMVGVNRVDATARIRHAVDDLDRTIREIRTTVFSLQQGEPGSSLRAQVIEAANAAAGALGFAPSVRFDGPVDTVVDERVREHLLPVVREALSNAARHAGAAAVSVEISARDELELVVSDDGIGVPAGGRHDGLARRGGLANMAARAELLGGTFSVDGASPGTVLRWRVPLRPRARS